MSRNDFGGNIKAVSAVNLTSITAGGAGDAIDANGTEIDRRGLYGACLAVSARATMAATATLALTYKVQHRPNQTGAWVDLSATKTLTLTGGTGGTTEFGFAELDMPLEGAKGAIRAVLNPNLSAASVDTAIVGATWTLGKPTNGPI